MNRVKKRGCESDSEGDEEEKGKGSERGSRCEGDSAERQGGRKLEAGRVKRNKPLLREIEEKS